MTEKANIFISHASKDNEDGKITQMGDNLQFCINNKLKDNIKVDAECSTIIIGESGNHVPGELPPKINSEIEKSGIFLAVLSENYDNSDWCKLEISCINRSNTEYFFKLILDKSGEDVCEDITPKVAKYYYDRPGDLDTLCDAIYSYLIKKVFTNLFLYKVEKKNIPTIFFAHTATEDDTAKNFNLFVDQWLVTKEKGNKLRFITPDDEYCIHVNNGGKARVIVPTDGYDLFVQILSQHNDFIPIERSQCLSGLQFDETKQVIIMPGIDPLPTSKLQNYVTRKKIVDPQELFDHLDRLLEGIEKKLAGPPKDVFIDYIENDKDSVKEANNLADIVKKDRKMSYYKIDRDMDDFFKRSATQCKVCFLVYANEAHHDIVENRWETSKKSGVWSHGGLVDVQLVEGKNSPYSEIDGLPEFEIIDAEEGGVKLPPARVEIDKILDSIMVKIKRKLV